MMKMKDLSSFASRESGNEQKQALTAFFFSPYLLCLPLSSVTALGECKKVFDSIYSCLTRESYCTLAHLFTLCVGSWRSVQNAVETSHF